MSLRKTIRDIEYKIKSLGLTLLNIDNPNLLVCVEKSMYILFSEKRIMVSLNADLGKVSYYTLDEDGILKLKHDIVANSFIADGPDIDSEFETAIMDAQVKTISGVKINLYRLIEEYGSLDQIPVEDDHLSNPILIDPVVTHNKREYSEIDMGDKIIEFCTFVAKNVNGETFRRNYEQITHKKSGEILSQRHFDTLVDLDGMPQISNTETITEFRKNYAELIKTLDPEVTFEDVSDRCVNSDKMCLVRSSRLVDRCVLLAIEDYTYIYVRIIESPTELQNALTEDETTWYRFRFNHLVFYSAQNFVQGGPFVIDWVETYGDDVRRIELLDSNKPGGNNCSLEYDFCEYGLKSMFLRNDLTPNDVAEQINMSNFTMLMNRGKDSIEPYFEVKYYNLPSDYKPLRTQSILDLNHIYDPYLKTNNCVNNISSNLINSGGFTMNNSTSNYTQGTGYVPFEQQIQNYDPTKVTLATRESFEEPAKQPTQKTVENHNDNPVIDPVKDDGLGHVNLVFNKDTDNYVDGVMPRTESGVIDFSALTTGRPLDQVLSDDKNDLRNNPEYVESQQQKERTVTQSIEVIRNFATREDQKVVADFSYLADPDNKQEFIPNPKFDEQNKQTLINEAAFYGGPSIDPFRVTTDDIGIIKRSFEKEEEESRRLLTNIKVIDKDGNQIERDSFKIWNSWLLENGMLTEDLVPDYNGETHIGNNISMTPSRPQSSQTTNSFLMNQHIAQRQKQAELEAEYLSDKSEEQVQKYKEDKEQFEIADFSDLYREKQQAKEEKVEVVEPEVIEPENDNVAYSDDEYEYILDEDALYSNIEYKTHMSAIEKLKADIAKKGSNTVRERKLKSHLKYIDILKQNHMIKVHKEKVDTTIEIKSVNKEKECIVSAEYVVNFVKQVLNTKGIIPVEEEWNQIMSILEADYDREMIADYLIKRISEEGVEDDIYLDVLENGTHLDGEMLYARDLILVDVFGLDLDKINEPIEIDENGLAQSCIDDIRSHLDLHRITDILSSDEEICDLLFEVNDNNEVMNYIIQNHQTCTDPDFKCVLGHIIINNNLQVANILYNGQSIMMAIDKYVAEKKSRILETPQNLIITPEFCYNRMISCVGNNVDRNEFFNFINKNITTDYAYKRFGQIMRSLPKEEAKLYNPLRDSDRIQEVKWLVLTDDFIKSELA